MAASGDLRQAASSAALNSTDDGAVMRRVPIVGVVALAALSVASAVLAVLLDLHQTRWWPVTHPFLFALAGALLAVPLTGLVTAVVVEARLQAAVLERGA
jgi:hypothetical protein